MKIQKVDDNVRPEASALVTVKEMGAITEVRYMHRQPEIGIEKRDKDYYVVKGTGEILPFNHMNTRADGLSTVGKSLRRLRDLINTNVTEPEKVRWICLTYRENMTDAKRLYGDFRKFIMRLRYYCQKQGYPEFAYIVAMEPQGRGAWHAHMFAIFEEAAPFIPKGTLEKIWGQGFVSIEAIKKHIDNFGAYFSAYLGDMDLSEAMSVGKIKGPIKEVETTDEHGTRSKKYYSKGARLRLYPPGFRLFRKSVGIQNPIVYECTEAEAMWQVGGAKLTYEKTISITDEDGNTLNVINYRQFNKKAK